MSTPHVKPAGDKHAGEEGRAGKLSRRGLIAGAVATGAAVALPRGAAADGERRAPRSVDVIGSPCPGRPLTRRGGTG